MSINFQNILLSTFVSFLLSEKQNNTPNSILDKYNKYLSNGVPNFYNNLINGNLKDFNPNEIDGLLTLYILIIYYGANSKETNKFNDFLKGTQNDIQFINSYIENILFNSSLNKTFYDPIKYDDKFINESIDPNCYKIPNTCKIILLCDWAIGTKQAYDVISKINKLNPDYLIYLGDVYYSGTKNDYDTNFFKPLENLNKSTKIFFIPGNHDYYSGSKGIYYCLDKIGQNATYFSIYNDYFQFEGFDTGYNDSNTFNGSNLLNKSNYTNTYIVEKENEWHSHRINVARELKRKIIFLTHHPPITYNDPQYYDLTIPARPTIPINYQLLDQVYNHIEDINLWFFGHIHGFNVFENYNYKDKTIKGCRLIGNGSCQSNNFQIESTGKPSYESDKYPIPTILPIFPNLLETEVNAGFVLLDLSNSSNNVYYYQIPQISIGVFGEIKCFFKESI